MIAGQVNDITIQAYDDGGTAADDEDDKNALTYKNAAMIRALDMASDNVASSVRYVETETNGVTDNGDGTAMLDSDGWKLGQRTVQVMSNTAIDLTRLVVQHMEAGQGGTQMATFEGAVDSFYVGAADFAGFMITAHEPDVDGLDVSELGITGKFDLKVVPVDNYNNPSVRAYRGDTGKKSEADSLTILDTRVGEDDTGIEYEDGIDVTFVSIPTLEELNPLFIFPIPEAGQVFPILLPEGRRSLTVQVKIEDDNLHDDDMRSSELSPTTKIFSIVAALTPMLTLKDSDDNVLDPEAEHTIPADPGNIMVTVTAEGYKAGSMVTINGEEVTADSEGNASRMLDITEAGDVMVSATDGRYSVEETWTFVAAPSEPVRVKHWADAEETIPVYLVYDQEDWTARLHSLALMTS